MDLQQEAEALDAGGVVEGLRRVVSAIDDMRALDALREEVVGVLDRKRKSIEDDDWNLLEDLARKHGHSVSHRKSSSAPYTTRRKRNDLGTAPRDEEST